MTVLARKTKVVAYITRGADMLVFAHRDHPDLGLQVPAGTLEPDEDPAAAVLREAFEETGLSGLSLLRYLGQCDFDISVLRPEIHTRHFYHLDATGIDTPPRWTHVEKYPSGGDISEIVYECFWLPLADLKREEPPLFLGFGAFLSALPDVTQK